LSHGASLNKVRMRAARPAFAIHMAWHNRNRGDAALGAEKTGGVRARGVALRPSIIKKRIHIP
jgi:hypothetical protein